MSAWACCSVWGPWHNPLAAAAAAKRLSIADRQAISQEKHSQTDRQRDKSTARFLSLPFPSNEPHVANLVSIFVPLTRFHPFL